MKAVILTGFMGAGKTTVGKRLGEEWKLPVIDTDDYIEKKMGKKISEIFEEDGEDTFRQYERELLPTLPIENVVITTGGGIVIQEENRKWMNENGFVVYLHCDLDQIISRIEGDSSRPLMKNNKEQIEQILTTRLPFYKDCNVTIDTTNKSIAQIIDEINLEVKKSIGGDNK
ncbi:shikimate kinase [Cytobacillus sp. IB215316]|uniref:shikimate kinase n=1 Tax=Cytobacillus sp. IB215316 TaxID=3097354 RepID=UPI002A173CD3|nr:shikimate kinase [Cytobacillus sp. IB215316]MDX8359615.1 shikimate kinase [Cytobacillus sp. IB215316]